MSDTDRSTSGDSDLVINIMEEEEHIAAAENMTRLLRAAPTHQRQVISRYVDCLVQSLQDLDRVRDIRRRGVSTIHMSWLPRCLQTVEIREQSLDNSWQLEIAGTELLALVISNARQALPFISNTEFLLMTSQIAAYAERIVRQKADRERQSSLRQASNEESQQLSSILKISGGSAQRISIGIQVSEEESSSSDFLPLKKKAPDSSGSSEDALNGGFRKPNERKPQK